MRQRIARFRSDIKEKFLAAALGAPEASDIIENQAGKGYRLNPYLVRVPPSHPMLGHVPERNVTTARANVTNSEGAPRNP